ncbi:MAG: histidine kinase [Saprospiraceae bacterium]|nr:histidine kinase [Saprospiraceae bacterium]MCB9344036.1 histidine kinase [Lewinellaceae bacterium]
MQHKKCFYDVIGFHDTWMMIFGIPMASAFVTILMFSDQLVACNWPALGICVPISLVYSTAFWFAMRKTYHLVRLRYPDRDDIWKRIMWSFLAFLVVFFLVEISIGPFVHLIVPEHLHEPSFLLVFVVSFILSALVIAIYEAAAFNLQLGAAIKEKAELERNYVSSQLEGLRNQVNPHFLFNSLNTLIYLIPEAPDKAVSFVQKMSKVYRYILESRDSGLIPLKEELDFLKAYVFLLKERFGDNLKVEIMDMDNNVGVAIVPLTLQMLFENAIKHNVISTEKPLRIEVFMEKDRLVVRNNYQQKNQVMDSTGVGLENIKDRYRILTDQTVEVIVSQQYFTVLLPIVGITDKSKPEYQVSI